MPEKNILVLLMILFALTACGGGGGDDSSTESSGSGGGGSTTALSVSDAESITQFIDEISPYVDEKVINRWLTYNGSISDVRYDIYQSIKSNFVAAGRYYHYVEDSYPEENAQFTLVPINRYSMEYEGIDISTDLDEARGARAFIGFKNVPRPDRDGRRLSKFLSDAEMKNKPLDVLILLNSIVSDDQGEFYESVKVWEGVFVPPGQDNAQAWGDVFKGNYTQIVLSFAQGREIPGEIVPKAVETYRARWERYAKLEVSPYNNEDDNGALFGVELSPSQIRSGIYYGRVNFDLPENYLGSYTSAIRIFLTEDGEIIGENCDGSIRSDGFLSVDCVQNLGFGKFLLTGTVKASKHRISKSGTAAIQFDGTYQWVETPYSLSLNRLPDEGGSPLRNYVGTWVISSSLSLRFWPNRHYIVEIDENGNITNGAGDIRCQVNGKLSVSNSDATSLSLSLNTSYRQMFTISQVDNNEPICDPNRGNSTEVYDFGVDTTHMQAGLLPIDFDGFQSPDNLIFAKHQEPVLYGGFEYFLNVGAYHIVMYRAPVIQ